MREVVERVTCDIGGEWKIITPGTEPDEDFIEAVEFSFNGIPMTVDTCGKCRPKMMRMSVQSLVDLGRVVQGSKSKKPAPKKRVRTKVSSSDRWAGEYDNATGKYHCPDAGCYRDFDSARKLGAHFGQVHTRKHQSLAKAV